MAKEFDELAAKLRELSGPVMRSAQRKGLKRAGKIMMDAIIEAAPERTDSDGGLLKPHQLKESYTMHVHVPSDAQVLDGQEARIVVTPKGYDANVVAKWVENGHAARNGKKKSGAARFVPANAYTRRAFDATEQTAIDAYIESVNEDIEKAMK